MQRHSILRKHFGERASKILTSVSGGVSRQEGLMPGPHISSGSLRSPSPGLHFANTVVLCRKYITTQIHTDKPNTPHKILADLFVLTSIKYSIIPIQLTRFLHCISYFSKSSKLYGGLKSFQKSFPQVLILNLYRPNISSKGPVQHAR